MADDVQEEVAEALLLDWHGAKPVPAPLRDEARRVAVVALTAVHAHVEEGLDEARQAINDAWSDFDDEGDEDPVPYARVALNAALESLALLPVPQGEEK